jgi:class 3 adenylate cyclase
VTLRALELDEEVTRLRRSLEEILSSQVLEQRLPETADVRAKLEDEVRQLRLREDQRFLLERVHPDAESLLLDSDDFRRQFLRSDPQDAFVMSVDLRRSTDLMLKAREPQLFADFVTRLCADLSEVVRGSYGVFDKFTGDGILAFYPTFLTGPDAGWYVLSAAAECHKQFDRHYRAARSSFTAVLSDVGLGIGVDFGKTQVVRIAGGLTVVGEPVVYACRLSGAPAGRTYLNQGAYDAVNTALGAFCVLRETELEIKHEGRLLAYDMVLKGGRYAPEPPDWLAQVRASDESKKK